MCKLAFSYIRFSTKIQSKGDSTRRQLELAQDYCSIHGLILDSSLRDIGVSAFRGKNKNKGALSIFIEKIASGEIPKGSTLIIESLDRLSRELVTDALETFLKILRKGIEIVTLDPLMKFDKENINKPENIFIVIGIMIRAREESELKSNRILKKFNKARELAQTENKKIAGKCPAWLVLSDDRTKFNVIKERAKIIKRIMQMSIDGYGVTLIAKTFNEEKIPTFGKSAVWHSSYVNKLINNKQLLGEHQLGKMVDGRSVKVGEVIKDYFPVVINEKLFYQVQKSKENRKRGTGKVGGDKVSNLFTGLLYDARDGSKMHHNNNGRKKIVVSYNSLRGLSKQISFCYEPLEESILCCCRELNSSDFNGSTSNNSQSSLDALEGELKMLENNILKATDKSLEVGGDFDVILSLLEKLNLKKNQIVDEIEKVKSDMANEQNDSVAEAQDLLDLMEDTQGKELYDLRMRLRNSIKNLISEIHCYIVVRGVRRWAHLQLHFVGGGFRNIICETKRGEFMVMTGSRDICPKLLQSDIRKKKRQKAIEQDIDRFLAGQDVLELEKRFVL